MSYEVGAIIISMLDVRNIDESQKNVPVVWVAGLRGLMFDRPTEDIRDGIAQAFKQSPYLNVGKAVPSKPGLTPPDGGVEESDAGDDVE